MRIVRILAFVSLLPGCNGNLSGRGNGDIDAPGADAAPEDLSHDVTGTLIDYDEGVPVPNLMIATEGLSPPLSVVSEPDGSYALAGVPSASAFYVTVSGTGGGYRRTVNPTVTVLEDDVALDLQVVTKAYANRLYTSIGRTAAPSTSVVLAELRRPSGEALAGVPAAAISLSDGTGAPVGLGPYFIGPLGNDIAIAQTTTAVDGSGRARIVYLDVPSGVFTLSAIVEANDMAGADAGPADGGLDAAADGGGDAASGDGGGDATRTATATIVTGPDGATLAILAKPGGGGNGSGMVTIPTMPTFSVDVYPILQRVSEGGAGCGSCHRSGGLAGNVLDLADGAGQVYARITNGNTIVNLPRPAASLILIKPLYEDPPNHPNAIFLDVVDLRYQTILRWISTGAPP